MGLDCFWLKNKDDEKTFDLNFDPPLNLCGGMCSGHGSCSFRGQVYSKFIEKISEISIYNHLTNDQVAAISDNLHSEVAENNIDLLYGDEEDLHDLRRMFKAYADAGAILHAWY